MMKPLSHLMLASAVGLVYANICLSSTAVNVDDMFSKSTSHGHQLEIGVGIVPGCIAHTAPALALAHVEAHSYSYINDSKEHSGTAAQTYIVSYADSQNSAPLNSLTSTAGSSDAGAPADSETDGGEQDTNEEEVEFTDSEPEGEQLRRATTCSLKNKRRGVHCEAFTCIRGGGSCRMGPRGRCVGRKLSGQSAPVACLNCKCTKDR